MIIDKGKILLDDLPVLWCPKCSKGTLSVIKNSISTKHPSWIRLLPEESSHYLDENGEEQIHASYSMIEDTEMEEFNTTFFLECNHDNCKEVISTCGLTKMGSDVAFDDYNVPHQTISRFYYPKYFFPSIRLFQLPDKAPKLIFEELDRAFSLFWSDPSACGNSIRKVVERIIDIIEPDSCNATLHKRIEQLNSKYEAIKTLLLATKWVGNDGSHRSDLTHNDVVLGFEFIENCLFELYDRKEKDLNTIAQRIIEKRRPISKIED